MNKEGIRITVYTDDRQQETGNLIISIQHAEFGVAITLDDQPDLKSIPTFYQSNKGNFWIAQVGGRIIGTIALLDIGEGRGALRKMFVHAGYRGKEWGVGQRLLDTLLNWAKEKQYREILLGTTEKFLAAQRFYEKNGFVEVAKASLPATFPIMPVDVKFYSKTISE